MHLVLEQALERYSTAAGRRGRGSPCCPPHPRWCGAALGTLAGRELPWASQLKPAAPLPGSRREPPRKAGQAPCSPGSLVRMGEGTPASSFRRLPPKHTSLGVRGVSSDEVPCAVRGHSCASSPVGRAGGKERGRETGGGGGDGGRFFCAGKEWGRGGQSRGAGGQVVPGALMSGIHLGWLVGGCEGPPTPSAAFPGAWGLWGAV